MRRTDGQTGCHGQAQADISAMSSMVSARCPKEASRRLLGDGAWKIRGCQERAVLFLHHHSVTSAAAAGRCLCLFKAVSVCGERGERDERGRPECRGSPSMRGLRARRNRGMIVRTIRSNGGLG